MEPTCACVEFLRLSLSTIEDLEKYEHGYIVKRFWSLDERRNIKKSAHECQLCQKIYDILEDAYEDDFDLPNKEDGPFVEMRMVYSELTSDENLVSSIILSCGSETKTVWTFPRPQIHFAAWADQQTPASAHFVDWPPIFHGNPKETAELASKLLQNCLSHHKECRRLEPAGGINLPSRVLSVNDDSGKISVKLVEGKGLTGTYCALSHCWGSEDKRPLRTTQMNITDHFASIPWDNLPALFQDAITLTKNLGIRYLWIDSLCIVQDDKQDWEHESKKMASIYRGATLVIAGVESENSTQRLSKTKRPEPLALRFPYYTQDRSAQGTYSIAESILLEQPVQRRLRDRGWVFQEFYLAQRKLLFSAGGLSWKCDESEVNERGNGSDLALYEKMSWEHCLGTYSEKQLTFPSDRIIALLGIVDEIGKSRTDSFVSQFGVWEDQLAAQLLWRPLEIPIEDLPDLPSWCWAATGGAKIWLESKHLHQAVINGFTQAVNLNDSGSLAASGLLIRAKTTASPLKECCNRHKPRPARHTLEVQVLPGYTEEYYDIGRFPIFASNQTRIPLGLALFDGEIHHSECFFFIVASSPREPKNQSHPDVHSISPAQVHRDTDECVDIAEAGQSLEVYLALVLQPVDQTLKRFVRVGMALMWARALKTDEGELTEFEIF